MNYIQHLSAFYSRLYNDRLFTPHHISLYMAIFQAWNAAHFENPFHVSREELMRLSKIGSVNTYYRCLKDLHKWNLIEYQPSKLISVGSRIRCITFDTTTDTTTDIRVRHYIKHNKTILNITLKEVEKFFEKENFQIAEASRFFNHYEAKGWMMGNAQIQNWQAAAINWMSNAEKFKANEKPRTTTPKDTSGPKPGNLATTTGKKYDEPL